MKDLKLWLKGWWEDYAVVVYLAVMAVAGFLWAWELMR